jgi:thiamine-phosphate pyrophosphorylase
MFSRLQYISQGTTAKEQMENIQSALDGACQWVQLRFKNADEKEFSAVAEQVKQICSSYRASFIINDHVEVAKEIDADGVHLGLHDMSVTKARNILGAGKIIGGTANTLFDVLNRVNEKCDYIGLGPFRFTATKEKLSPVLGLEGFENIMNELDKRQINIPVYAIGGILDADVESVMNTGVFGIAVSGMITAHPNKKELIQKLNSMLYEKVSNS